MAKLHHRSQLISVPDRCIFWRVSITDVKLTRLLNFHVRYISKLAKTINYTNNNPRGVSLAIFQCQYSNRIMTFRVKKAVIRIEIIFVRGSSSFAKLKRGIQRNTTDFVGNNHMINLSRSARLTFQTQSSVRVSRDSFSGCRLEERGVARREMRPVQSDTGENGPNGAREEIDPAYS